MRSESARGNTLEGAELVTKCDKLWTATIDGDDDDDNDVLMIVGGGGGGDNDDDDDE